MLYQLSYEATHWERGQFIEFIYTAHKIFVLSTIFFLRLGLLWGFSEDILHLDNYTMLFCFFQYRYISALQSIFFEIFVSEMICFIHRIILIVQSVWYWLSLRNKLLVLTRRIKAIVLWAKPFDGEKLDKRDFKLLTSCFWFFVFRFANIWRTTETYSPQTFSVTAAVVAQALVICLNSLIAFGQRERMEPFPFSTIEVQKTGKDGDYTIFHKLLASDSIIMFGAPQDGHH